MVSMKNKKGVAQFLFISLFFASIVLGVSGFADAVLAQSVGSEAATNAAAVAGVRGGDNVLEDDGVFTTGAKYLLYAILWVLTGLVQVAASVFAWATKPEYISGATGLLNLDSVYNLWKFVRDFFNLFFIFLLLFSAFATVFQIEQFGIKKNFFKIIFAAIAINFSFPLTRIIIDLGNVPMYFFAEGLVKSTAGDGNALYSIPSAFFQSSRMGDILTLPDPGRNGTLIPLLSAVIFTFIFMITLFTLAILFVVRLLKLVILLIFSPLGVAASLVPGLGKLGKDWWSNLFQTVFFGPAAMLMIVIALRFTLELNGGAANTGTTFTQGLGGTAQTANATSQSSIIAQGVFFIPIILMWMAMHLGNKFGIEGSKAVIGRADKVAAWGKKQAMFGKGSWTRAGVGVLPGAARVRGIGAGIKGKYGDKVSQPLKDRREAEEARGKAFAKGLLSTEKGSLKKEQEKARLQLLDKQAREQEKKWKDDGKTISEIAKVLDDKKNKDKDGNIIANAETLAAAKFLSNEKEGIKDANVLAGALAVANASKNKDLYDKVLSSATDDALDMTPDQIKAVRDGYKAKNYKASERKTGESDVDYADRLKKEEKKFDDALDGKFRSKYKKEGKMKVLIDYEIEMNRKAGKAIPHREVYAKYMGKMKTKEIAQMQDVYDPTTGKLNDQVATYIKGQNWTQKEKQDAFAELNAKNRKAWKDAGLAPTS